MAKSRQKKESEIKEFVDGFTNANAVVFADLSSLKVNDASSFRRTASKEDVGINTAKKTLLKIALKEAAVTSVDIGTLGGSVSMLFGMGDAVAPARILEAFRKDHDKVKILGGILEDKWLTPAEVLALAKLPSKQQLLGQLVGVMNAPVSGFVNVLAGNLRGLVTVLGAVKDAKASA
jgi:large subunit ribosomal protein L10